MCKKVNEREPLISIIVTVYKVEKYIAQCVLSLIKQTYKNLEIILVNDGSPDNSLKICKKYAEKDNRIKIVDLVENQGLNRARFQGMKVVSGEYIMFVDSDDFISLDAVETLYGAMNKTGADIVEGNFVRVYDSWGIIKRKKDKNVMEITQPELFYDYFITFFGVNMLGVQLWGKLYRKELFEVSKVKPNRFRMGEDLITNMQIFPYVKKYVVLNDNVYYYRYGGMTSNFNPTLYYDLKEQYYLKKEMIEKYEYKKGERSAKIEMCNVLCSNLIQMYRFGKTEKEVRSFIVKEIVMGFVDEITIGIEYDKESFTYLKKKDIESLLIYCRKVADEKKTLRYVFNKLFPLLRFI
ncbi:glycosyltransferase family 2 protein [Bacteroides faecium]|uniref:Glycosyltransferase family 2 protein n=1 Tax=Bacteroides faecium TaxID=2715212 RepID=A0A6H0KQ44_9BACE|nr:glycosyltransferase family 2 protein [Bacteroides faecium]QIU95151.1 glycosyltransferase family 2 protein [Bacteroides faecium]